MKVKKIAIFDNLIVDRWRMFSCLGNSKSVSTQICIGLIFTFFTPLKLNSTDLLRSEKFRNEVYVGINDLYNFRFHAADSVINKIQKEYPDMAGTYLLSANYYWWQSLSGNDSKANKANFFKYLDIAYQKSKNTNVLTANEDLYSIISIYAFRARYQALHMNYIQAISDINNCIGSLKKSFGKETLFEPFNLTSGLYNYMIFKTRQDHPLLYPYTVFLPDGSKVLGLYMLERTVLSKDVVLSTEANYFLYKIYAEQEKDLVKAGPHITWLVTNYPNNLLYQYFYFNYLLKSGKVGEAEKRFAQLQVLAIANKDVSQQQREYFYNLANKDLKKYKKNSK